MKTRYNLTLIGTVLAIAALSLPFIISETSPKPEISSPPDHVLIGTLLEFGCSELAINYLMDSSNLLDEEFDGVYVQNFMGLPDGLSDEDFDKCLEIAIFIRENNMTRGTDEQLQKVLDHCQKKELAEGELVIYYEDTIPFYHYNTTYYIGTNSCQWHLLENHPDSDILCIPGIEKWVSSEVIRNSTHIYDKSTCQWYRIISSFGDPVYSVPFGSSEEDYSNLEPIYMDNPNNSGELILDLDAMIAYENLSSDVTVLDCNIPNNPHKEYQCFRDAFSNCQLAKVDPDQYTIEGSPIHTNVTITDDCKIYGIIDTITDVHGDRGIITSTCETLTDDQYGWNIKDCDASNYPEMHFNYEMQLYPQILECEENGNTWVRENLECVEMENEK